MAYEMKEGQGSLFKNQSDNPKAPTLKGNVMINGQKMDIAGWVATDMQTGQPRKDRNGNTWINITISEPYQPDDVKPASGQKSTHDDFNDDIPW
jgi:hypothetical protein